jgi:decaprenylphospho-beta-D-ribofuranose 2-oxidase
VKKKGIMLLLLVALCILNYKLNDGSDQDPFLITDYSRLHPVKVDRVVEGKEEEQLIRLLREAGENNLSVSIAGQRHSQGGHTYYKDGIVVDMTSYNRIIAFDPQAKTIRVQAGATWKDVQDQINPYGLSVKIMQSQNIFTVGGSISINAHGRDIRNGSMIKSVESFRLLTANGQIIHVSRTENADLFPLALGGYGLFGIILDVSLTLTDNEMYSVTSDFIPVDDYSSYFRSKVKLNDDIHMHFARVSVAPDSFLTDMYATNYTLNKSVPLKANDSLQAREEWVIPTKLLFQLNRVSDWGKNTFWNLQKMFFSSQQNSVVSRNNAMRSESEFMEYREAGKNDLLQEYFIPVDEFSGFVKDMRAVLQKQDLNLLNITVRYVKEDRESALSYANTDMFALVCLFNVPLSDQGQARTKQGVQHVIDEALRHGGTYYLPYAAYPSLAQFRAAYPRYGHFFAQKDRYDPQGLFMNYFYEQYKGE